MKNIPFLSFLLGILSPIPLFIMNFIMMVYLSSSSISIISSCFIGYAGILLSFIGGVNWALTTNKPVIILNNDDNTIDKKRLLIIILTVIIGEGGIVAGLNHYILLALIMLMIGFAITIFLERNAYLPTELPTGYVTIRLIITFIIQLNLIFALFMMML